MSNPWDQRQGVLYKEATTQDSYSLETGTFMLPVAEEPPTDLTELLAWSPVAVITAHAPYRLRTTKFQYKKSGNPPVIPAPATVGDFVFLAGEVHFPSPTINSTLDRSDWVVGGEYIFVESCQSSNSDGFVMTTPPYVLEPQYQAVLANPPPDVATSNYGAGRVAGLDARLGIIQSDVLEAVGLNEGTYLYESIGFFPASHLHPTIINGDVTLTEANYTSLSDGDVGEGGDF